MRIHAIDLEKYTIQLRSIQNRSGRNIICIHGVGASSRYWLPLAKYFKNDNVYIPDLPGFGGSDRSGQPLQLANYADFIAELLAALHLQNAVFIGNSYGCQIILEYIQRYGQDKIDQLVLIGPTVYADERYTLLQFLRVLQDIPRESAKTLALLLRDYMHASPRQCLRSLRDALDDKPEDKLENILISTLVIRGKNDKLVPQLWAERITRALPQGELAVIPGSGHVTHSTAASEVARSIHDFLI